MKPLEFPNCVLEWSRVNKKEGPDFFEIEDSDEEDESKDGRMHYTKECQSGNVLTRMIPEGWEPSRVGHGSSFAV